MPTPPPPTAAIPARHTKELHACSSMHEFPRPRAMALGHFAVNFQSLLRGSAPTETRCPLQAEALVEGWKDKQVAGIIQMQQIVVGNEPGELDAVRHARLAGSLPNFRAEPGIFAGQH